jgi:hypothetical protein
MMVGAYLGWGARVFRKREGRISWLTWLMLWPVLLGQRLSLMYYARGCRAWDALTERVWIGRVLSDREAQEAIAAGVTAVLDLTGEFSESRRMRALRYRNMPVLDLTCPTEQQLAAAAEFIAQEASAGVVYVHCKIGYSRTAAVAGAYLMASGMARDAEHAVALIRAARPSIIIRPEIRAGLKRFASVLRSAASAAGSGAASQAVSG